jgi:hypothetical protein
MLEVAVMLGAIWWVIFSTPPSNYRAKRLAVAAVLLLINITAIVVAVGWAKVTIW